jgi:hypothetical protein
MPRVRISIGDLKCIKQADSRGTDDVYWIANLRSGPAADAKQTQMAKLWYDECYRSSQPEMLAIGTGQTKRFTNPVIYDEEVRAGNYVYGTVHFLERDTPLGNYVGKIAESLSIVIGGLAVAAVLGFIIGFWLNGISGAFGGAIIGIVGIGTLGFLLGAIIELLRPVDGDVHLGGLPIVIGPLGGPPPASDKDAWPLTLMPAGKLEVVDAHGAELTVYPSSHMHHATSTGHRYETVVQLDINGGHR